MIRSINISLLILASLALSCSKSSPAPAAKVAATIVGSWKGVSSVATGCNNPAGDYSDSSTAPCGQYVFTTGGTYTSPGGTSGTYTISGTTVTFDYGAGPSVPFTFTVTSTTLILAAYTAATGCTVTNTFSRC